MDMNRTFSRIPKIQEAYFLRRPAIKKNGVFYAESTIFVTQDKDECFRRLRAAEAEGTACWIEDRKGNKIS
jgi:hypothetical protein